jgi:MoaA/NifB/PqqE/SkfB family radical SAM enzyme
MELSSLSTLAWKHTISAAAETVYLNTGYDNTKPVTFYGLVNERCNVKCRYCEYWRLKHYNTEMTIEEWKSALSSIKDFVGHFSINFSGGEPFIKPGFIDLLAWCNKNGISAGVTTNGSALTQRNAAAVVAGDPFNVNISVDAPNADVHDYLRGYPGLFNKLSNGIRYLIAEREHQGKNFPINIKPTVNSKNFRLMPELVEWAVAMGASCVQMQPMDRWTPETYDELWVEEPDMPEFEQVVDRLVEMQQDGAPILTPPTILRLFPDHFRGKKAPESIMPCRVGLRDFFIRTDGEVQVCVHYPSIGNVREQSAREIWYGLKAQEIRRQTVACDRLCLITCLSQKTLKDKVGMGMQLLKGQKRRGTIQSVSTSRE